MTTYHAPLNPLEDRVEVVLWGDLPESARGWAIEEMGEVVSDEQMPLIVGRVTLLRPARPAQPCRADIAVNLGGHLIHARGEAATPQVALHVAAERVRRQAHGVAQHALRANRFGQAAPTGAIRPPGRALSPTSGQ